jgi:hypothetical protein
MKTKPTVYLSGKITGLWRWYVVLKFTLYTWFLQFCGFNVWSPLDHVDKNTPWGLAMDICIPAMDKCDFIFFQFDWKYSRGARIEFYAGASKGLHIINLSRRQRNKYNERFIGRYHYSTQKATA